MLCSVKILFRRRTDFGMYKAKDPGIVLEDVTVDTPLPDVVSFRVSYQEKVFRCREYNTRGNKYIYLERNHRQKKITQYICKPGELDAVLIREAAKKLLVIIEKREEEYQAQLKTEKDLHTIVMELQEEVARLSKKVDAMQAG